MTEYFSQLSYLCGFEFLFVHVFFASHWHLGASMFLLVE